MLRFTFNGGDDSNIFQQEWDALLKIECSRAVKCPSLGTFLAGMKKIQEYLYVEKNLIDLCDNDRELVDSFQAVFARFLRLDDQVTCVPVRSFNSE